MQGTPNNVNPIVHDVLDLDELLASRKLDPVSIKLGGKVYKVRRDLTGAEVADFYRLASDGKDVDALAILVTSAPVMLNKTLERLPVAHMKLVLQKFMEAAGLLVKGQEDSGESQAS
jgi:hypothetical protein